MSDYFVFGGFDTRQYCDVFRLSVDGAPARAYDARVIPGRNGNIILDGKRYNNHIQSYTCVFSEDAEAGIIALRNALLSRTGYQRLADSINPDEYYMAYYGDDFSPAFDENRTMAKVQVEFTRKPQRFLTTGENAVTLTASGTITNPTPYSSKPLLRIYGAGTVGVADNAITILSSDDYVDIDCEMMEAYKGTVSLNSMVEIQNTDFPVLHPDSNGITLGTGITKVELTPRWFRL